MEHTTQTAHRHGHTLDTTTRQTSIPPEWIADPRKAPRWLTSAEVSAIWRWTPRTTGRLAARKSIRVARLSHQLVRYDRDSIIAYVERCAR